MQIHSKMKVLECSRHFPHCRSIGIFIKHSRAANSAVHVRIRLNFKIIRDFIVVLVTCKNEEDPIKNEGAVHSVHTIIHRSFRLSRADNSRVRRGIWPKFTLFQAFMQILTTCKNGDDSIKNKRAKELHNIFPL